MRINAGAMAKNPEKACEKCGACSSAGEHYVDIVGVTGSIPVTPTIFPYIFEAERQLWRFFAFVLAPEF
jgi:hypothetical protein